MVSSSQVSLNKRGRDEYLNGGLALPDAKRSNSVRLVLDSDLKALLAMIDNMDAIDSHPEESHTSIQLEDELRLNGVMKSLEDAVGLKGPTDDVESVDIDEKGGLITQITDWNSEASSAPDIGNLTYYDDVRAELGFFVDHTAVELGIIMNLLDGDSMANMHSDAVYGYTETVYGSLWEDDIWQFNEHPVIQNGFASPQQEEFGIGGILGFHHFTQSSV